MHHPNFGEGGELAAIERIRRRLPGPPAGETWIGDDAAIVAGRNGFELLTTDTAVAGVHADLALVSLEDMGWKAMAAAVSDIAAMGGRPDHTLVSVAGPPDTDLDRLVDGLAASAAHHGAPIVGGDLVSAPVLVVTVTVTGHVPGAGRPVRRHGATVGDRIMVTGPVGGAAAGLRALRGGAVDASARDALVLAHRRPLARLAEGEAARRAGATAMIDISDGLSTDVAHLAAASGVGAGLSTAPVATGANELEALAGGDDYELVFTTPDPDTARAAFAAVGLRPPIDIGVCAVGAGEVRLRGELVTDWGYEHQWPGPDD